MLLDSTANVDKTLKKELYQTRFRTPEYFWFSPETLELEGYHLVNQTYEAIITNEKGLLWSHILGLHLGIHNDQLRYFLASGELVPTPVEAAEQAEERAAQLAEQLRSLGIEPQA